VDEFSLPSLTFESMPAMTNPNESWVEVSDV
jgi:hypothetical protein